MKKHLKNISLVISGVVLGVAISFSGEISAATSKLIGSKVGKIMTVSLDDKKIGDAPVIGGTSYVPVRTAANELGLEVAVEGNEIKLTSPEESVTEPEEVTVPTNEEMAQSAKEQQAEMDRLAAEENEKNEQLRKINQDIETATRKIANANNSITNSTKILEDAKSGKSAGAIGMDSIIKAYEEEIEIAKKTKSEQEKILADLESQLAALK